MLPTRKGKQKTRDEDGHLMETSTEYRDEPYSESEWKTTLEIFKTTLLMCICANPDKDKLQIALDDLGFYEFLNGPRIAQSSPPPTLAKIKIMERKAWYNINLAMHKDEDLTLKEAIGQTGAQCPAEALDPRALVSSETTKEHEPEPD